jgi:hypothetical protein
MQPLPSETQEEYLDFTLYAINHFFSIPFGRGTDQFYFSIVGESTGFCGEYSFSVT